MPARNASPFLAQAILTQDGVALPRPLPGLTSHAFEHKLVVAALLSGGAMSDTTGPPACRLRAWTPPLQFRASGRAGSRWGTASRRPRPSAQGDVGGEGAEGEEGEDRQEGEE